MLTLLILALASGAPSAATAQPPAPQAAAAAGQTLQQDFDAATAASNDGRCADAVPLFEALEKDRRVAPGSMPAAAIAARKGKCLIALGRYNEGKASITAGLAKLEAAGESFSGDVYDAQMSLGLAALHDYDFASAEAHYNAALKLMNGMARLPALVGLAKATAYDGTNAPLAYAEEAIRIVDSQPKPDKQLRATFMTLHARTLLDQGQNAAAYDELKQALKLTGGLTQKVTLDQVATRGDLAMAALLLGKRDDAHLYLAYTGAGRIAESPFGRAETMDAPVCGSETGLRPEDEAVVEFSIEKDGRVSNAQTVYTRGDREVAAAFASAVRKWYWDPVSLAKIPPFYLAASRIELRCTRAGADAPGVFSPLKERLFSWARTQLMPIDLTTDSDPVSTLNSILSEPDVRGKPARFVAAKVLLSDFSASGGDRGPLDDALAVARASSLPAQVISALQAFAAVSSTPWAKEASENVNLKQEMPVYAKGLFDSAERPEFANDALAADTLRLAGAQDAHWFKDPTPIVAELKLVADDNRLEQHDPLRQVANLQLADLAAQAHDLDAAHAYFERTGLTEEQCSLLGVHPALRASNASSSDYPTQALAMGFEGWARVEFDIKADGKTVGGRTVIAYPPFVFSDGATAMSKDFVFESSYRPGGNMACSADHEEISFKIPQKH